jgi:hypothetical protein
MSTAEAPTNFQSSHPRFPLPDVSSRRIRSNSAAKTSRNWRANSVRLKSSRPANIRKAGRTKSPLSERATNSSKSNRKK